jgi:PhoH-like ATPase
VSLVGKAGTGKTLLAMAAGLEQVLDPKRRQYRKIVVMRPLVSVGKEMGWLPGDVSEKIHPWMKPIFDNVQFLLGDEKKDKHHDHGHSTPRLSQMLEQGILELEAMSFVRGRSINDAFIVIDEAQNLTPHEMKTLMTRAAGKSKVVLTGDLQQIDTPYLDSHSSGLTHVVKKFREHPIAGHVTLVKGERSELAELAADLL